MRSWPVIPRHRRTQIKCLKKLEAEQRRKSLQTEKRKLEAQKALIEAEEMESIISMKSMSRTSKRKSSNRGENRLTDFRRLGSETSISITRPSASTPIVRLQPTSFLQGVTPLKGIFSGESSSLLHYVSPTPPRRFLKLPAQPSAASPDG